jgi:hypothetical protein
MNLIQTQTVNLPTGETYHLRAESERLTEFNTDKYVVAYTVNGSAFDANGAPRIREFFATRAMWHHHRYAGSHADAILITLGAVENALYTRHYRQQNATLQTAEQRQGHICHLLKHDPELQALVDGVYPSAWTPSIRIQCNVANVSRLQEALAPFAAGVDIEYDTIEYVPFRGIILDTQSADGSEVAA